MQDLVLLKNVNVVKENFNTWLSGAVLKWYVLKLYDSNYNNFQKTPEIRKKIKKLIIYFKIPINDAFDLFITKKYIFFDTQV